MTVHTLDLNFLGTQQAIAAFLVESKEGLILVETGPNSCFKTLKKGIEEKGFSVEDIQHVFITHIHMDHAGSAWVFAEHGAQIYVHPIGYPHLLDPSRLMSSAHRIYGDQLEFLWGNMKAIPAEQLHSIEDEQVIKIGDLSFKAWYTPGHAPHHIAWQLEGHLFAGDVAGVRINNGMVMAPCPPPDIDFEAWMESIATIRKIDPTIIYITHFGPIDAIKEHLDGLEFILKDWSEWMRPYFEQQVDKKEIIPKFEAYVKQQLIDYGIDEEGLLRYERSNPAALSVHGIMRYWKKKLA